MPHILDVYKRQLLEEGEKEQGTGSGKRRRGTASAEPGSEAEGRR